MATSKTAAPNEPRYDVLWPLSRKAVERAKTNAEAAAKAAEAPAAEA